MTNSENWWNQSKQRDNKEQGGDGKKVCTKHKNHKAIPVDHQNDKKN